MYKMLIVDDEPEIADSIFELFQTESCGYELELYKCTSGQEALKILSRIRVDIVLTDINMPCFSGFRLVEEINRSYQFCQIIFMTGFNSQEYMRSAIQYNNVQYVLKNEPDQVLLEAVSRAAAHIRKEFDSEVMVKNLKRVIHENMPILKRDFMVQVLKGREGLGELQERAEQLGVEVDMGSQVRIFLVVVHDHIGASPSMQTELYLKSLVTRLFPASIRILLELVETNIYACVVQPSEGTLSYETVRNLSQEVHSQLKVLFGVSAAVVLSREPSAVGDLREVYRGMLHFYFSASGRLEGEFLIYEESADPVSPSFTIRSELETLGILLEKGDLSGVLELLNAARDSIANANPYEAKQMVGEICLSLMKYCNKYRIYEDREALRRIRPLYDTAALETEYQRLEYLRELTEYLMRLKDTMDLNGSLNIYHKLVEYIDSHLQEDLTLTALSEKVHFNPSYISRQFKAFSGVNLTDYITKKRMDKAKRLLLESNQRVYDIAVSVGYDTATYFNRVFRKYVGVTPREFRGLGNQDGINQ